MRRSIDTLITGLESQDFSEEELRDVLRGRITERIAEVRAKARSDGVPLGRAKRLLIKATSTGVGAISSAAAVVTLTQALPVLWRGSGIAAMATGGLAAHELSVRYRGLRGRSNVDAAYLFGGYRAGLMS